MRLTIAQRLLLSIMTFAIPIAVLAYFVYDEIKGQIEFAALEVEGNNFQRPLTDMLHGVLQYRYNHNGDIANAVDSALDKAKDAQLRSGDSLKASGGFPLSAHDREALKISEKTSWGDVLTRIERLWGQIKQKPEAENTAYDDVVTKLRGLIAHVGDTSNLTLDPDLDTYYLMDVTSLASPEAVNRLGDIKLEVANVLKAGSPDSAQAAKAGVYAHIVEEDNGARIVGSATTAIADDADFYGSTASLQSKLPPLVDAYKKHNAEFVTALKDVSAGTHVAPAQLEAAAARADNALYALYTTAAEELNNMLAIRIAEFRHRQMFLLMIATAVLIGAFGVFYYVARHSIIAPLNGMQQAMLELADNKLDTEIPGLGRQDEIGDMAQALDTLKQTSIKAEKMGREQAAEQEQKLRKQKNMEMLIGLFDESTQKSLGDVSNAADGMKTLSGQILDAANVSSEKTAGAAIAMEQTSGNVRMVAAAAEELTAAIKEISSQMHRSTTITSNAVNKTRSADDTVNQLTQAAAKIGEVVGMITEIAAQINLLALNATIESARAGEAGKGFAVVASEVKNLAGQTSKATEEIASHISGIQGVVRNVVTSLNDIRSSINEMNEIATVVASAVEEQGAATQDIARNILTVSDGIENLNKNLTVVQTYSGKTNEIAKQVETSSITFSRQATNMKEEVESFLHGIKTA